MHPRSSLTHAQRERAVALFEQGLRDKSVATTLGVSRYAVRSLLQRWQIRGRGALAAKPTKQTYTFDTKLALVQRCLAGETPLAVAQDAGLSSPVLLRTWM